MKTKTRRLLGLSGLVLLLAACQTPSPREAQVHDDPACVITQASYDHIHARHCTPSSGASQLLPKYCTKSGMQTFCGMVQNAPQQYRVVQKDQRVRYDSNLGVVVGTAGEKCGRLVITSETDGEVVTEFPELTGAPGVCQ